eukprot:8543678-Pyramimonas_sp.AAC.1
MRNLRITLEQPLNSMLYKIPSVRCSIRQSSLVRCVTWMGAFGGDSMKPDEFYTNVGPHEVSCLKRGLREARERVGTPKKSSRLVVETVKSHAGQGSGRNK